MHVFVYGSLRKGASNNFRMKGARYVGCAAISGRLYRVDWYPGVKIDSSANDVQGDVYVVDGAMMSSLDEYEGSEYVKRTVRVRGCAECSQAVVWEYLPAISGLEYVPSGDWFDAEPGHG